MEYTLKSGAVVTDDDLARIADAFERGEFPGKPGKIAIGRPRLSQEPLEVISFKVPHSMAQTINRAAKATGESRSSFLRDAAMEKAERTLAAG